MSQSSYLFYTFFLFALNGAVKKRYARLTRFFTHLCLFFNQIDIPISPLASQKILEAYVTVLEVSKIRYLSPIIM